MNTNISSDSHIFIYIAVAFRCAAFVYKYFSFDTGFVNTKKRPLMSNQKIAGIMIPMATSKEVLRDFARYIKDAHPTNAVPLTALVRYVQKRRKSIEEEDFDKEKVFEILFPKESYKPSRMDRIYSKAVKLSEDFLLKRGLEKRPYWRNMILAEVLNDLQLDHHANKKLEENLDNLPEEEEEKYGISYQANLKIYNKGEKNLKEKKKNCRYLIAAFRDKEIENTIANLKICCEILAIKLVRGTTFSKEVEARIKRGLSHILYREHIPLIDLLARSALFLQQPTKREYYELKNQYFNLFDQLYSEKKEILQTLINGIQIIPIDNRFPEFFSLFKFGVEKGLFVENNKLVPNNFNNIVLVACESQEIEWAENFIDTHFNYLNKPTALLQNIRTLYECFLHFGRKEYTQILEKLDNIQFEDFSYGIHKYTLQLKSTYELEKHHGYERITKAMEAYKSFLKYNYQQEYISKTIKENNLNSLRILNKIARFPYDKGQTPKKLLAYFESFEGKVVFGQWLKAKIKQLK